jgi:hypothetical protein
MSTHCKRLADLNTQFATTARELAVYHQKLAVGSSATRPSDGTPLRVALVLRSQPSESSMPSLPRQARLLNTGHSRSTF